MTYRNFLAVFLFVFVATVASAALYYLLQPSPARGALSSISNYAEAKTSADSQESNLIITRTIRKDVGPVLCRGNTDVEHKFELANHTGRPLSIREIRRYCGCLQAKLVRDEDGGRLRREAYGLPPDPDVFTPSAAAREAGSTQRKSPLAVLKAGETVSLSMTLSLTPQGGRRVAAADVITDMAGALRYELAAEGYPEIEYPYIFEHVRLADVQAGARLEQTVMLYTHGLDRDAPRLSCVTSGASGVSIKVTNADSFEFGGGIWKRPVLLTFEIPPARLPNHITQTAMLELDDGSGNATSTALGYSWYVSSHYVLAPQRIHLGHVNLLDQADLKVVQRRVRIRKKSGGPLTLVSAAANDPAVTVVSSSPVSPTEVELVVEIILRNREEGPFFTEVEIQLDDPAERILRLPVSAFLRRPDQRSSQVGGGSHRDVH